jgi:hypothetical protein
MTSQENTIVKMKCELSMFKQNINKILTIVDDINGAIGIPILLYFIGVPGILVIILWAIFFRG